MAYCLFTDESGHDLSVSPYAALAGVSVEDRDVWDLIGAINDAELDTLGQRHTKEEEQYKGKEFLKRQAFRHALLTSTMARC